VVISVRYRGDGARYIVHSVVTLASASNPAAQVTTARETGSAAPQPTLTIEVADIDAVHAKAVVLDLQVA